MPRLVAAVMQTGKSKMDVILLERIENLGGIGDRVKVKSGYGRNYLLPQGKATLATPDNIEKFEAIRAELEAKAADELGRARIRAERLAQVVLTITAKAGSEGKLFGSVGPIDIADAFAAAGEEVERSEIRLADGPIRITGSHQIEVHLHTDVNASVTVNVVGEGATAEELEALTAASSGDEAPAAAGDETAEEASAEEADEGADADTRDA